MEKQGVIRPGQTPDVEKGTKTAGSSSKQAETRRLDDDLKKRLSEKAAQQPK